MWTNSEEFVLAMMLIPLCRLMDYGDETVTPVHFVHNILVIYAHMGKKPEHNNNEDKGIWTEQYPKRLLC